MFQLKSKSSIMLVLVSICLLANVSCKDETSNAKVQRTEVAFKKEGSLQLMKAETDSIVANLEIEIADDSYQTETGLMYRQSMANDRAMLFIFPDSEMRYFYMKNTLFALDIIDIDEAQNIVSIQKNAEPGNESSLASEAPAKYVLEVNAGLTDQWGLEAGDRMVFTKD